MDNDCRQQRDGGFKSFPDPPGQLFAGWILQAFHFIEVVVVEAVVKGAERGLDIREIHHPAKLGLDVTADVDLDPERMTMKARTLVAFRNIGEPVRGFDGEGLEDFHGVNCMPAASRVSKFQLPIWPWKSLMTC